MSERKRVLVEAWSECYRFLALNLSDWNSILHTILIYKRILFQSLEPQDQELFRKVAGIIFCKIKYIPLLVEIHNSAWFPVYRNIGYLFSQPPVHYRYSILFCICDICIP